MSERDNKFFMARVADQAERYMDVVKYINEIIDIDPNLTDDERNLLSVSYKAMTGTRRTALRTVNAILEDSGIQSSIERKEKLVDLRETLIKEIDDYCQAVIDLVDQRLLPVSKNSDSKLFYLKLKADYYRYSVEFKVGDERTPGIQKAKQTYEESMELVKDFSKVEPPYLGLALNYTVFLYEILGQKKEAIDLAEKVFREAIGQVDKFTDSYSETTLILQLLKDNIEIWNSENV